MTQGRYFSPSGWEDVSQTEGLRSALSAVDEQGWECAAGQALLAYARTRVVRSVVTQLRLDAARAREAEAIGWVAAWQALRRPGIRTADSPWGVVHAAARSAVLGELLAATYGTSPRQAWRLARLNRVATAAGRSEGAAEQRETFGSDADRLVGVQALVAQPPVSLTVLTEAGWDLPDSAAPGTESGLGPRLGRVVDVLAQAGWPRGVAETAVAWVASTAAPAAADHDEVRGWRPLAAQLDLPLWQTRRLVVLLLGTRDWPGLVERLARDGDQVLHDPAMRRAVRATTNQWLPAPRTAHQRARPGALPCPAA